MPTYDYHCDTCERDFEIYMSIAKRNEPINEECSANNCSLKLKISSPTIGYDNFSLTGKKTWYAITPDGQGATCSNGVTIQPDGPMEQISKEASVFVC